MKVTPTAGQQPICAKKRALPLRDTEHTKAAGNIRSWQEKHIQGTAFHIFCARSPLSGTGTESPGNITVSIGTIPSPIREVTHRKGCRM